MIPTIKACHKPVAGNVAIEGYLPVRFIFPFGLYRFNHVFRTDDMGAAGVDDHHVF